MAHTFEELSQEDLELAKTTGPIIKYLRKKLGITQDHLAEVLNVSRSVISGWEASRRIPSIPQYREIAAYFNVSVDYLAGINIESGNNIVFPKNSSFDSETNSDENNILNFLHQLTVQDKTFRKIMKEIISD